MKFKYLTFADICIAVTILMLSIMGYAYVAIFSSAAPSAVVIEIDGREYARYPMGGVSNTVRLPIKTKLGYNLIEITPNSARILEADCPDKLCVVQGAISKAGQTIVCLPHRLVIHIEGKNKKIDATTF